MAVRDSKRALAQVAALLGTDTAAARTYLRRIQRLAGPVPYDVIAQAMRQIPGHDAEQVAARLDTDGTGNAGTDRTDRANAEGNGAEGAGATRADG